MFHYSRSILFFSPSSICLLVKGRVTHWNADRNYGFIIEDKSNETLLVEKQNLVFPQSTVTCPEININNKKNYRNLFKNQRVSFGIRSFNLFQTTSKNSNSRIPKEYMQMKRCVNVKTEDGKELPFHFVANDKVTGGGHTENKPTRQKNHRRQSLNRLKKFPAFTSALKLVGVKDCRGYILCYPFSAGGFIRFAQRKHLMIEDIFFSQTDVAAAFKQFNAEKNNQDQSLPPLFTQVMFDVAEDPIKNQSARASNIRIVSASSSSSSSLEGKRKKDIPGIVVSFFDQYGFIQPSDEENEQNNCYCGRSLFFHIKDVVEYQRRMKFLKLQASMNSGEGFDDDDYVQNEENESSNTNSNNKMLKPRDHVIFDLVENVVDNDGKVDFKCVNVRKE